VRILPLCILALVAAPTVQAASVDDATALAMAKPQELIVAGDITPAERTSLLTPVEAFYGFWENGSQTLLDKALSPRFVDHTLPPGRPQGPAGPATASKAFLAAIPDLQMAVVQRLAVGDRVVSHLRFTGHFTGTFGAFRATGSRWTSSLQTSYGCRPAALPTTGILRTISPSSRKSDLRQLLRPPDRL
jgi:predicted ester cyclase